MDIARNLLELHFRSTGWKLTRPPFGRSHEAYIAENEFHSLFIKFDIVPDCLATLSSLRIAPHLLAYGAHASRPYVIQELVKGVHPTRQWLAVNAAGVARTIKRYHGSTRLMLALAHGRTSNGVKHAQMELAVLLGKFDASRSVIVRNRSTFSGLRLLAKRIACIPLDVVPTHGDLNPSNLIVASDALVIVDWDGITLSDRWRDISLVLWRYVDRARWREFFNAYGVRFGWTEQERFYWWLAHGALTIAIWFVGRGDQSQAHLHMGDFLSAVSRLRALASRGAKQR
jgi:hypothetical protein